MDAYSCYYYSSIFEFLTNIRTVKIKIGSRIYWKERTKQSSLTDIVEIPSVPG